MTRKFTNNLVRILGIIAILTGTISALNPIPTASASVSTAETLTDNSVMFIENVGQFDDEVRFVVRGDTNTTWLTEDGQWTTVYEEIPTISSNLLGAEELSDILIQGVNFKITFVDANPNPTLEPFNRLETNVNYFIGNDPEKWKSDVPVWGGVRYKNLYPGIDFEVSSISGQIIQELVVKEGGDLDAVKLQVEGADVITLASNKLLLDTSFGSFSQPLFRVVGVEESSLQKPSIAGDQVIAPFTKEQQVVEMEINQDDTSALLYSTYLGGGSIDAEMDIALDNDGSLYITGYSSSSDFPLTPGAFKTTMNDAWDGFVAKLNPEGNNLSFSTFFGGSDTDNGIDIAIDANGASYVTGWTQSPDFPTTLGAYNHTFNTTGYRDTFLIKLSPDGASLDFSTFLGGSADDTGWGIAVGASNSPIVTGYTSSTDFPTTSGVFDATYNDNIDVFVTKFNSNGSALTYSTYLGGNGVEKGNDISINTEGDVYIAGITSSDPFPTTVTAYDTSYNGGNDVFLVKFSPDMSTQNFSTLLGGSSDDAAWGLAINNQGSAFITGGTSSSNYPVTSNAYDMSFNGGDAFVTKVNPDGTSLAYSTFIGKSYDDWSGGYGIAIDSLDAAYISGFTDAFDFPTTPDAFDTTLGGESDAYIVKINPSGSSLLYASFLGGSDEERKTRIALDATGSVYVSGWTYSSDFPTTEGSFDPVSITENGRDLFVTKLMINHFPEAPDLVSPIEGWVGSCSPIFLWNSVGDGVNYQIQVGETQDFTTTTQDITLTTGVLTYTSECLKDGQYFWRVRAIDLVGYYGDWSEIRSLTIGTLPSSFNRMSPLDKTLEVSTSPTLTWNTSTDATSYQYCYDTSNDNACSPWVNNSTDTSVALSGLTLNTTYFWQVRAINDFGTTYADGSETAFWSFTTGDVPGAFNKITPLDDAIDQSISPSLTWTANPDATSYQYCYDTSNDNACSSWADNGSETSVALSGLTINTTYYWQVRAINDFGTTYSDGSESAFWSFTTGDVPGVFNKITPLDDAFDQTTNITLNWETSNSAEKYEYCIDTTDDNACSAWTDNGDNTNKLLTDIYPGITYYWNVRAVNTHGITYANGSSSSWWSFTVSNKPGYFNKITPSNSATRQLLNPTISWTPSVGATSYQYCVSTVSPCTNWLNNGLATSKTLIGLSLGTTYYWNVRAVNSYGRSYADLSKDNWSFTTGTKPEAFKKIAPTKGSTNQALEAVLSWNESVEASSYEYCIDTTNDNKCNTGWKSTGTSTSIQLSGLTRSTSYYWQVRARNIFGKTLANNGNWWTFTTTSLKPDPFSKIAPMNGASNQLTNPILTWEPSLNAASYEYCIDRINDNICITGWQSVGSSTSVALSGLKPGKKYFWQIRAINTFGKTKSNEGAWWAFTTTP